MSSFVIKIIAIITMTIDHVNDIFYQLQYLNIIGRIAFPLFCFQVVVGYSKTRNLKKYLIRLFIFSIISQIPYYFFSKKINDGFCTNVIITLFLGVVSMYIYDLKLENIKGNIAIVDGRDNNLFRNYNIKYSNVLYYYWIAIKVLFICVLMQFSYKINSDYNAWGILLILIMHAFYPFDGKIKLFRKTIDTNKVFSITIFLIIMMIMSWLRYIEFYGDLRDDVILKYTLMTFAPSILTLLSNGKKGISLKYFFYIYYPLHLIIILLVQKLVS